MKWDELVEVWCGNAELFGYLYRYLEIVDNGTIIDSQNTMAKRKLLELMHKLNELKLRLIKARRNDLKAYLSKHCWDLRPP